MSWHGRFLRVAVLAVVLLALVSLMYQPTSESLTTTLPWNLGDPALNTWILSWEWQALTSRPLELFQGNIFHPYGDAIKNSETMLPLVPVFGVIEWASGSSIVAHNVLILILAGFSVLTTYLLGRRVVGPLEAGVAAVAFSFSGYVFMHQSQLQLLTLGFFPLAFLLLLRALERQELRDGIWLGVSSALLTTASLYYGSIWFLCLLTVVLADLIRRRRPPRSWWRTLAVAGGVIAATVGPIAYVYARFQSEGQLFREVGGLGLNPIDFLTPSPTTLVYPALFEWASERQPTGVVEHGFFLGFTVLALAIIGTVLFIRSGISKSHQQFKSRTEYELGFVGLAAIVSIVVAVGPEALGVKLPFGLLADWVPGYDAIRASSRLAVPGLLGLALFAAWALKRLLAKSSLERSLTVVTLVTAIILVELWATPLRAEVGEPDAVRQLLLGQPAGPVVELPMRLSLDPQLAFLEGPRLLESIGDWRPRFNGYSGAFPPGYLEEARILMRFPSTESIDRMYELGIRYVVLHGGEEKEEGSSYSEQELSRILDSLPPGARAARSGDDWLVDLEADA